VTPKNVLACIPAYFIKVQSIDDADAFSVLKQFLKMLH
jgi:hypothetical protein